MCILKTNVNKVTTIPAYTNNLINHFLKYFTLFFLEKLISSHQFFAEWLLMILLDRLIQPNIDFNDKNYSAFFFFLEAIITIAIATPNTATPATAGPTLAIRPVGIVPSFVFVYATVVSAVIASSATV